MSEKSNRVRIFISWSGEPSKAFAESLSRWLARSLQSVQPFVSSRNIEKGTEGRPRLARELRGTNLGIICLTKATLNSPWILFEAGALAKESAEARVWTFLLDMEVKDIPSDHPLATFQHTKWDKRDIAALFSSIDEQALSQLGYSLGAEERSAVFGRWWPDLEKAHQDFCKANDAVGLAPETTERSENAVLEELVRETRAMSRRLDALDDLQADVQHIKSSHTSAFTFPSGSHFSFQPVSGSEWNTFGQEHPMLVAGIEGPTIDENGRPTFGDNSLVRIDDKGQLAINPHYKPPDDDSK